MMRIKNMLVADDSWGETTSVVPPSAGFPYWTVYPKSKSKEGYNRAVFMHIDLLKHLEIQDDNHEEVKVDNGVRNNQMPDVLSDYSDITRGSD